jgi:hypothetical protein
MKISRRGATANHGESVIELNSLDISWDNNYQCVLIKSGGVKDFNTDACHTYKVYLEFDDLGKIVDCLGNAALISPKSIENGLDASIKSIIKLMFTCSGLHDGGKIPPTLSPISIRTKS